LWVLPASAEPSKEQLDAARALAYAGLENYEAGEWQLALDRFTQAERIYHAPSHLLFIARANAKLGHLVAARDAYRRLVDEELAADAPKVFHDDKASGQTELAELEPRVPSLSVSVANAPTDATLALDGKEVTVGTLSVDPGSHQLVVTADGFETAERSFEIAEGAEERIEMTLTPLPPSATGDESTSASEGSDLVSWVPAVALIGVGVAGLAVGGVTGGLALSKNSQLDEACPVRDQCPRENQALEDDGRTLATVSTIGFAAGGAAVAAGAAWWLFWPSNEDADVAIRPYFDGEQAGIRGSF
jgi:hypothetical protein